MKWLLIALTSVSSTVFAVEAVQFANCTARVIGNYVYERERCAFPDEAMVGINSINPLQIRCGRIYITCTRTDELSRSDQDPLARKKKAG